MYMYVQMSAPSEYMRKVDAAFETWQVRVDALPFSGSRRAIDLELHETTLTLAAGRALDQQDAVAVVRVLAFAEKAMASSPPPIEKERAAEDAAKRADHARTIAAINNRYSHKAYAGLYKLQERLGQVPFHGDTSVVQFEFNETIAAAQAERDAWLDNPSAIADAHVNGCSYVRSAVLKVSEHGQLRRPTMKLRPPTGFAYRKSATKTRRRKAPRLTAKPKKKHAYVISSKYEDEYTRIVSHRVVRRDNKEVNMFVIEWKWPRPSMSEHAVDDLFRGGMFPGGMEHDDVKEFMESTRALDAAKSSR